MTVSDLIDKLAEYPGDKEVYVCEDTDEGIQVFANLSLQETALYTRTNDTEKTYIQSDFLHYENKPEYRTFKGLVLM